MTKKPQRGAGRRDGAARTTDTPDPANTNATKPGYLIRRLHQIADSYFAEETAPHGVTPVQYGALCVVAAHPGIDQLRLGNALRCDRTTVSGVVRRLESKRLIRRTVGRTDRRAKALYLTPTGERLLARLAEAVERAEARILTGLNASERRSVFAALERVIETYESAPKRG